MNAQSEGSSYVLTVDDTEHSGWSLQFVVCLSVQMYTFLNVGVCELMSVGECHRLSEYISFMCFHTELTIMFFVMKTGEKMTVLLHFAWYLNAYE